MKIFLSTLKKISFEQVSQLVTVSMLNLQFVLIVVAVLMAIVRWKLKPLREFAKLVPGPTEFMVLGSFHLFFGVKLEGSRIVNYN